MQSRGVPGLLPHHAPPPAHPDALCHPLLQEAAAQDDSPVTRAHHQHQVRGSGMILGSTLPFQNKKETARLN